jgi:pimeloyl-ACP methyl ester carboxylesterase
MTSHGPAVFVHGNPETSAVWGPLLGELARADVVCLSPPGFGAPLLAGFGATMDDYRDWLIARLEAFRDPVDLVGHDWGGAHVLNAVMQRPDLVRSWVSDALGLFDPDYVWHALARTWQTPAAGEQSVQALTGAPLTQRIEGMHQLGITSPVADALAAGQDAQMARAILALYRSAVQPALSDAARHLPAAGARPGLALSPVLDDTTGTDGSRRRVAERAGAEVVTLEGVGHWWMVQDPHLGAEVLSAFWAELP